MAASLTENGAGVRRFLAETGASDLPFRACSACDGDYEDPDRTARMPTEEDDEPETDENEDGSDRAIESQNEFRVTER